jgi:predicted glycosyltransferase
MVLHSDLMPTKHDRIAITRDPEVDAALKSAGAVLGPSTPAATLARELLLRGAQAVLDDPGAELDRWLDERGGVTRPTMSRDEALALAREIRRQIPPGGSTSAEILDDIRADRI